MVQVSFLEIYAERVFDLLTGPRPKNVEDSGEEPAKHARLIGLKGQDATRLGLTHLFHSFMDPHPAPQSNVVVFPIPGGLLSTSQCKWECFKAPLRPKTARAGDVCAIVQIPETGNMGDKYEGSYARSLDSGSFHKLTRQ